MLLGGDDGTDSKKIRTFAPRQQREAASKDKLNIILGCAYYLQNDPKTNHKTQNTKKMKKTLFTTMLLMMTTAVIAQETHYHRGLRSQDTNYGLAVQAPPSGVGMYWSRVRNVDDVAIDSETPADSIARRNEFKRLCEQACEAFRAKDYYHTLVYGDSALQKRYHTGELYYYMAVSYETLGDYEGAEMAYRLTAQSAYMEVPDAYPAFKQRMKQRKAEEKQRKKEEKRRKKEEKAMHRPE